MNNGKTHAIDQILAGIAKVFSFAPLPGCKPVAVRPKSDPCFKRFWAYGVVTAFIILALFGHASSPAAQVPGTGLASPDAPLTSQQDQTIFRAHAIAMHGEPKYQEGFAHFDYVNPNAPKGGALRQGIVGTFDSFNLYIIKGNPIATGNETLLISSADEPFTEYGLIAKDMEWPEDRSWITFYLNEKARWHDGKPVTPEDVIFSLDTLKSKGAPLYRFYYNAVEKAEKVGPNAVKFTFSEKGNRELPLIVGQMPIFPKHYWEERSFESPTLEPPLTSGPYRIGSFEAGRYVTFVRVPDYWGKDLPVKIGHDNFDTIRFDFFRDVEVLRQSLKAGDIDYRAENQAKAWALDYDIEAVRKGWLNKVEIEHGRPVGNQAFVINTRRAIFADERVRQALGYAFDFEWTNPNLFFGAYKRNTSYFNNSELASRGLPAGEEKDILERFGDNLDHDVLNKDFTVPRTDGSGYPRDNLLQALGLLEEAGWVVEDTKLVNSETGLPFSFEILLASPSFERIMLPYVRNLKKLGMDVSIRLVDETQYINRVRSFDFDMIMGGWGQSDSPGNEQREYWSSEAADQPGSRNYAGVKDPVVDELINLVIQAPDRDSLVARTRALDRVLLWGFYSVPAWHADYDRVLYWDKFSLPDITPDNGTLTTYWWYDEEKAETLAGAIKSGGGINEQSGQTGDSGFMSTLAAILAVLAGLGLAGWLVAKIALRSPRDKQT